MWDIIPLLLMILIKILNQTKLSTINRKILINKIYNIQMQATYKHQIQILEIVFLIIWI
jgi:hypothetical protein